MPNSPDARRRRVVVTGIGAVTPAGWGVEPFAQALLSGATTIAAFTRFDHASQRTHLAGQVPAEPSRLRALPGWPRLSNTDRFAVGAALEASRQAGLSWPLANDNAAVFFASSTGGLHETEAFVDSLIAPGAATGRRGLLASYSLSSPAEAVARRLGVAGPVETISSACAASTLAIEQALRAIRRGEVDVAITGGSDCLCLTTYSGFNALRAVDERPCRPFRTDRAGLSLGEGAAVLVLESLAHAVARGAAPLAEVLGAGASCDASHMTAPVADGAWAAEAMRRALGDAGLDSDAIDFLNAHGTATPLNDAAERAAMVLVFGERAATLPIEATKGVVGHLLGAAGAVEAVATILSLRAAMLHPTPAGGTLDAALGVDVVLGQPRALPDVRTAMSANLGFGGANAALILGRWNES